jgi:tripartite-type tricarboxylate transporter receptor subunit TctC
MRDHLRRCLLSFALLGALGAAANAAPCQQSIMKIVVPFPPGGSYDILARNVAQGLGERWNQKVVVENRSGGNGEVGTTFVANSPADGCTVLFWGDGILISQGMVENRAVHALKSFAPVALVARTAQTVIARADFRAKTLPELIELSKRPDVDIRYATAGIGTPGHLAMELLNAKSGSKFRHVPYRGGALALSDLLAGQIELVSTGLPALIGQIQSGKTIALAVSTEKRMAVLPDVPAMNEAVPGVFMDTWYGFLAAADTPDAVLAGLHQDIAAIMASPALASRLQEQGFELVDLGPAELRALMERDLPRWLDIVSIAGLKK